MTQSEIIDGDEVKKVFDMLMNVLIENKVDMLTGLAAMKAILDAHEISRGITIKIVAKGEVQ